MSAESSTRRIAKIGGSLVAVLTLALTIAIPVSHGVASKFESGLIEMAQREQSECEARGGTYTPKPLWKYETQCVSEKGYYIELDAYTEAPAETPQG